jgi:CBS domain-containing protein
MPISDCCTLDVVCCTLDTGIFEVAALMRKHHVGDVVVVQDAGALRTPVGIVTDRDIVLETIALQVDAQAFSAADLMSSPVLTVPHDAGLVDTLRLMRHHLVRRAAVLGSDGALLGIVSADDIVKLLALEMSLITDAISKQAALEARARP